MPKPESRKSLLIILVIPVLHKPPKSGVADSDISKKMLLMFKGRHFWVVFQINAVTFGASFHALNDFPIFFLTGIRAARSGLIP